VNWLVATQSRVTSPLEVAEVRMFVVIAETETGARALIEEWQKGQMVRWIKPDRRGGDVKW
jgi:hypothetical protein